MGNFWCSVAVLFISEYGIAVFRVQAVCGKFKFHVVVVGEKTSLYRGDLHVFHDKRMQILKGPLSEPARVFQVVQSGIVFRKQSRQIVWLVISLNT